MRNWEIISVIETEQDYQAFMRTWKDKPKERKKRTCRDCGNEIGRHKQLCDECRGKQMEKRLKPPHHCRECGAEIQKQAILCSPCRQVVSARNLVMKREIYRLGRAAFLGKKRD